MGKNQHRWKKWIEDQRVRKVLEEAAAGLAWAWTLDRKTPDRFPVNTWYQFVQIEQLLQNKSAQREGVKLPRPSPPPKKLSDLVDDGMIKAVYEDHHEGSYEDALIEARGGFGAGYRALRRITRALDIAYVTIYHGLEHAPNPKVHLLHRNLLDIANSRLGDLTLEGIAEFFDDLCPCGTKHLPDTIRKLKKRRARARRML